MTLLVNVLNDFGRRMIEFLWPLSVELALFAVLVVAALAILRPKSPSMRHLFWCLVLVKPLTTLLVATPVSMYGFLKLEPAPRVVVTPTPTAVATGHDGFGLPGTEFVTRRRANGWRLVAAAGTPVESVPTLGGYGLAGMAYLLVVAGLGLRLALGYAYVSSLRHAARIPRDGPLAGLLADTMHRMGIRRRAVLGVLNTDDGPILAGMVRPVILMPEQLTRTLTPRQLEYVIAHELTHLRRWDNLILVFQRAMEVVLFFHPAIWLCGWALRREAEAACDDAVLRRLDGPAGYADSLTRVAEVRGGTTDRLLVTAFVAPDLHLAARVRRIMRGPASRTPFALTTLSITVLVIVGAAGLPTAGARSFDVSAAPAAENGGTPMSTQSDFGFRVDPMRFVEHDRSLEGAIVRALVFGERRPVDDELIRAEIAKLKVFEPPTDDEGGACDGPPYNFNQDNMLRLALLGATEDHPEIQRALSLLEKIPKRPKHPIGGSVIRALCIMGRADHPAVRASLRIWIDTESDWIRPLSACPWTPTTHLMTLWAARELENAVPLVERGLRGIHDEIFQTGCLGYMDPWEIVDCAAHIDHSIARDILLKQIPMLLRAQRPDGGWGENSFKVFAALKRHRLLDELRGKPPLPPDWRVVRSIPAPGGDLWGFVWDGERMWTGVRATNEAVAIAPQDGRILARVKLPEGHGRWLGWWNGKLAVTQGGPPKQDAKRLLQIDPADGRILQEVPLDKVEHVGGVAQVEGELWLFDAFFGSRYILDAAGPRSPRETHDESDLPCSLPIAANSAGNGAVWLVDVWSPWIIKTDRDGRLLDWSERPFEGHQGIVWDGEKLWAIDEANQRICAVEKTPTAPRPPRATME